MFSSKILKIQQDAHELILEACIMQETRQDDKDTL